MDETMRVKDLIASLQTLDPELPVHRCINGEYPPVLIEYAGYTFGIDDIMRSKNDRSFYGRANSPTWTKILDSFEPAFKAVIIS